MRIMIRQPTRLLDNLTPSPSRGAATNSIIDGGTTSRAKFSKKFAKG